MSVPVQSPPATPAEQPATGRRALREEMQAHGIGLVREAIAEDVMAALGQQLPTQPATPQPAAAPPATPQQGQTPAPSGDQRERLEAELRRIQRGDQAQVPPTGSAPPPEQPAATPAPTEQPDPNQVTITRAEWEAMRRAQGDQQATTRRLTEMQLQMQQYELQQTPARIQAIVNERIRALSMTQGEVSQRDVWEIEQAVNREQQTLAARARFEEAQRQATQTQQVRELGLVLNARKQAAETLFSRSQLELLAYANEYGIPMTVADIDTLITKQYQEPAVKVDIQEWADPRTPQDRALLRWETAMHRAMGMAKAELIQQALGNLPQSQVVDSKNREQVFGDSSSGSRSPGDDLSRLQQQRPTGRRGRRDLQQAAYSTMAESFREDMEKLGIPIPRR